MGRTHRKSDADGDRHGNERHRARGRQRPPRCKADDWGVGDVDDGDSGEVTDELREQIDDQREEPGATDGEGEERNE